VRKLVLPIVVALALVGAGLLGWKWWSDSQRLARYDEWRKQVQGAQGPDDARRGEIIAALREELRLEPGNVEARALLGETLVYAGKKSDAVVELREAVKRDPGNVDVHIKLAQICLGLDLVDEAVKVLDEALAHADDDHRPKVELVLGFAFQERYRGSAKDEDFRAARNYFQDARRRADVEAAAMEGYAALWLMKGRNFDFDKGIASYRELLAKHPDYPAAPKIRELLDTFDNPNPTPDAKQPDAKPSDTKPADAKPPESKPDGKSGDG
jgi:tetratricopeptide (TPR) repeat protein